MSLDTSFAMIWISTTFACTFFNTAMKDNRDAIDFSKEPVAHLFRKMLIPTLVSMVSMVILNITDGAFIGHGAGSEALAAINIAAPIFNIMTGIGIMFGMGCSVVSSIHLSRGKKKAACINITQTLIGSFIIALMLSIIIITRLDDVCLLFGSSHKLLPLAGGYLWWVALGEPLIMLEMTGLFIVRLDGSPKFAMACSLIASAMNIFLDWLLIFPFGMGLEGAAIATSFSFSLSGLITLYYLLFKTRKIHLCNLKLSTKSLLLSLRNISYHIRLGFSAMLGELAISGVIIAGNFVFMHYLGEDGVAAFSVSCYCLPIIFMMANSIVQSGQPIVSSAFGIDDSTRLRQSRHIMTILSIGSGFLVTLILTLGAPIITSMFLSPDSEAYNLSIQGMPYFALGVVFIISNIVAIGYLQSIERSGVSTILTLLRGFILSVPSFIIMPILQGTAGIWLAVPVAELMTTIIMLLGIISYKRH